jgi:hypothetical protein
MMDDDLLITNAFYPILKVTDSGSLQKGDVEYGYYRDTEKPYLMENLGPNPNINLTEDQYYDERTKNDFKVFLKKKEKILKESTYLPNNNKNKDTSSNSVFTNGSNVTTEKIKKDYSNDLMKYSQVEEGFNSDDVSRVIRDTVFTINVDSRWKDDAYLQTTSAGSYPYIYQNKIPSTSYSYTITLPKPIRNIKMVEIKGSEMPYNYPCIDNATGYQYNYILLSINELNNMNNSGIVLMPSEDVSKNNNVTFFFTKIQLNGTKPTDNGDGTYTTNSILFNCHVPITTVYTNAIQEVSKLTINFYMPNGAPYKINDHSFSLEFISYTDSTSVTDISTRRGATDITIFNKVLK